MPLSLALRGRVIRHTYWSDDKGNIVQVSAAVLDAGTWDPLAECTKRPGPFDSVKEELAAAQAQALAAADRQTDGQLSL